MPELLKPLVDTGACQLISQGAEAVGATNLLTNSTASVASLKQHY